MEEIGLRLQPAWMVRYLVAPEQFGVPASVMPAQFYRLSADRRTFEPMRPDAGRKIAIIVGKEKASTCRSPVILADKSIKFTAVLLGIDKYPESDGE